MKKFCVRFTYKGSGLVADMWMHRCDGEVVPDKEIPQFITVLGEQLLFASSKKFKGICKQCKEEGYANS